MSTRKTIRGQVPVSFLIAPGLYERLRDVATANHRTIAGELRGLVEQHVRAHANGSDTRPTRRAVGHAHQDS